jgi:hypothetical protein
MSTGIFYYRIIEPLLILTRLTDLFAACRLLLGLKYAI